MYEKFLMHQITQYRGQWYCYKCKSTLQGLIKAERHVQEVHRDINTEISDFLDKSVNRLTDEECEKLLNHGIVIRQESPCLSYFCLPCQCEIFTSVHLDEHLKGKRHEKSIQVIAEDSTKKLQNDSNDNMNKKQSNASVITESSMIRNFCESCQCSIPSLDHLDAHLKGKRHKQSIQTIAEDSINETQDDLSDNTNKTQNNPSVITETSMIKHFCESCQCKIPSFDHLDAHLKGKRHQKSIQAIAKDSAKKAQNLNDNINKMESSTSDTIETSIKLGDKSKSAKEPVCAIKLAKDFSNNSTQMAKSIVTDYSLMQEADLHKHFAIQGITRYNGQWYCYMCKQNLKKVRRHLQNVHLLMNTQMSDFLDKSVKLYLQNCKELLNHGIVIRNESQDWFCLPCQCSVPLNPFDMHLKGKNHQKCIQVIAEDSTKMSKNLSNSINKKQSNATDTTETLPKLATKLKLTTTSKSSEKVSISTAELVKGLPDVSYPLMLETNMYKLLLAQRITRYNGQWCCDKCKSMLQSLAEVERHLQEVHTDVNIMVSNFLDKSNLTNEECEKLLNHGIVVRDVPQNYFCLPCQCLIPSLINSDLHLKGEKHQQNIKTVAEHFANDQQKTNDNTDGKQNNLSTNAGTQLEHTIESKFIAKVPTHENLMSNILNVSKIKLEDTISLEACEIDKNIEKELSYSAEKNDAVMPSSQILQKLLESKNIDATVAILFKISNDMLHDSIAIYLRDALKKTFETRHFPVEVWIFGSRFTGLALPNSNINIYLDFVDKCTEAKLIENRFQQIQECLWSDFKIWEIKSILTSRTPIIKVKHILTGLDCDISFTSPLSLENSKLVKSFIMAYPSCKKIILFLRIWLSLGNLSGPSGITNFALTWLVIFYLQVKYEIPSIAALIKCHNRSKKVSGWETGVGDIVPINVPKLQMHELLLGFFTFYANFDFMHCIVCPLLGDIYHKESFARVSDLPSAMTPYVAQLRGAKPECLRVDSPMCVQDPFELSHNLTKAVSISTLERFKQYCNESFKASILRNIDILSLQFNQKEKLSLNFKTEK